MKLSFVIPAYNEEALIGKCLESILEQVASRDNVEIIVVNNASTDRTREAALAYPNVRVVDEPRKGLVRARQAGYLASSGDLIANVDADVMLTPGWVERVFSEFSENDRLVGLSGPYVFYDLSLFPRLWIKSSYVTGYLMHLLGVGALLQGGNFILRRAALEQIKGFDTSIEFYGEDTEIANRIARVGDVKFTFRLPMLTTGRRFKREGFVKMGVRYILNHLWMIFFKKPYSETYLDIR
jgi:glycosyltransferase involved in cell wall biosynthesis